MRAFLVRAFLVRAFLVKAFLVRALLKQKINTLAVIECCLMGSKVEDHSVCKVAL